MPVNITFGIIVLNGEPFTRYCIRALYPHAHEIIIAEGACEGARNVAAPDGHSRDGTLDLLRDLRSLEDPENKITIVTAEEEGYPDGFWPGEKHEQCRAFAKRATGNFLWQVDIDEFYLDDDIRKIKTLLIKDSSITCVSFKQFSFWGGFDYLVDSWYFKRHLPEIYRIFKWEKGFQYTSHRPPTVIDNVGANLKEINFINSRQTEKMDICMYHYSFVFPKQVKEKAEYYKSAEWSKRKEAELWADDIFLNLSHPYRVFSVSWIPSWLVPFKKAHPKIITHLIDDISSGLLQVQLRHTDDIDILLNSFSYKIGIAYLKLLEPFEKIYQQVKRKAKGIVKSILKGINL